MSAPGGIAQTTPESIELAAGKNVIMAAAGNHDTSILGKITMAAGKCISLFAQSTGIKIFASKGKVEVQAQGDEMDIEAFKDITMKSSTGKILIAAKQEIILTAGSGYIRIGNSQVEIGAPDHILLKTAVVQKQAAASMASQFNTWQTGKFHFVPQLVRRGSKKPISGIPIRMERDTGDENLVTDKNGKLPRQHSDFIENIKIKTYTPRK